MRTAGHEGALMQARSPFISVVIAAYNDSAHLAECLDALARQDYGQDAYEVIVVDDGSTDETAAITRARPWVRYLHQENAGPSAARNAGVLEAKGEIVAFTDSDCAPEPGWLSALAAEFATGAERLGAVGGPHIGHPGEAPFARDVEVFLQRIGWTTGYMKVGSRPGNVRHLASCNAAHRRDVFLRAGGFRPGLFPGEDVDLDRRVHRMGYTIRFTPEARVFHHRPADAAAWRRMVQSYGESSGNNIRLHGFFRGIHFFPPLLLGNLLLLVLLGFFPPLAVWTAAFEGGAFCLLCAYWGRAPLGIGRAFRFAIATLVYFSLGYWARLFRFHSMPLAPLSSEE
jgi:GT2 family glycosyltransferase